MTETKERRSALDEFASMSNASPPVVQRPTTIEPVTEYVTAKAVEVKRDERAIFQRLKAGAAAAGSDWFYRFPVKNKKTGQTDWIEGPTIKLANELRRIYMNCTVDIRVQDLGEHWLIYAKFTDIENGTSLTRPFQQRKSGSKLGGDDDGRRLEIALGIGTSKAIRNVTVNALPMFSDFGVEEAKGSIVDKIGNNLPAYRGRLVERFREKNTDIKRIEAVVGRVAAEWLAPDIGLILGIMKSVEEGMQSFDEAFPPLGKKPDENVGSAALDEFVASGEAEGTDGNKAKATTRPRAKAKPDEPAAGDGGDDAANAAATSPADKKTEKLEKLKAWIAGAQDEATVHECWERLDLDNFYNDDPFGRREAWKLCTDRIAELNGGDDGE